MDYVAIVSGIILVATGFIIGRVWSMREYLQLQAAHDELTVEHKKLTDRDSRGRFTKREKGTAL